MVQKEISALKLRAGQRVVAGTLSLLLVCSMGTFAYSPYAYADEVDTSQEQAELAGFMPEEAAVADPVAYSAAAQALRANLAGKFAKGGVNGVYGFTYQGAMGLNALSRGGELDAVAIAAALAAEEEPGSVEAGLLGKYIIALASSGVDCHQAVIGGETRNLVEELENQAAAYENYWGMPAVIAAFTYAGDASDAAVAVVAQLRASLLGIVDDGGLMATSWGQDVQLTAQSVNALIPYADDPAVAAFLAGVADAIASQLNADGSCDAYASIDTAADVVCALAALGVDPLTDPRFVSEAGATPFTFLVDTADADLSGYSSSYSPEGTEACVLLALSANELAAGGSYNAWTCVKVIPPVDPQPVMPDSADSEPANPEPAQTEKGFIPATSDTTAGVLVVGIAVAAGAVAVATRKENQNQQ